MLFILERRIASLLKLRPLRHEATDCAFQCWIYLTAFKFYTKAKRKGPNNLSNDYLGSQVAGKTDTPTLYVSSHDHLGSWAEQWLWRSW